MVSIEERECFHAVSQLNGKKIVLFGAGRMAEHYFAAYGGQYRPAFIVDNDPDKWGGKIDGIEIQGPDMLAGLVHGTYRIVIAVGCFEPIVEQLSAMGIGEKDYRIYNRKMDTLINGRLYKTISDGKYHMGYVTGVFDLFHIGHLNLLRNCKTRCHYLVAGVLTDELTEQDKHKKPFIPFAERLEIVKQCKYVDRVIAVDFRNTDKVDAWEELRYGCLFAGGDHKGEPYWMWLQSRLRSLGSELEFFPYTESTSSTMLQAAIRGRIDSAASTSMLGGKKR